MSFNEIQIVNSHAFRGLKDVQTLILKDNNLQMIAEGALDDLVSLQTLDLRNNPLTSYTTNAWYFCTSLEHHLQEDSPTLFKNFRTSALSDDYCSSKTNIAFDECIRNDNGIIDCTSLQDFKSKPCNIKNENFTNIIFNFPTDADAKTVENFYEGESNVFFQEFNSQKGFMEHSRFMKEFTLYETKYDLTQLKDVTSQRTKVVNIKADTVYISAPVTIHHHLNIQARVVALDFPISMNMSKEIFSENPSVEAWANKEEYYYVGKVLMNRKCFGLVTVLQSAVEVPAIEETDVCHPQVSRVEETEMDVSDWYDLTTINLHHVCAMTVMKTGKNALLAIDMSHFMLNFVYNLFESKTSIFIAAQRFYQIQEPVDNGASYSIEAVESLAYLIHDRMTDYKANELNQETQLALATFRVTEMQNRFETVKRQQNQYFSTELSILDSIWAAIDNQWDFNFDHRCGIEGQISSSMEAIHDQIFNVQEQELTAALSEATMSKKHIDDVIESYINNVDTLDVSVKHIFDVQSAYMKQLKRLTDIMERKLDEFEHAIEDWKHKSEVKAVRGIFKAVFSFGTAISTGNPVVLDLSDIMEFFDLLMELIEIIESCQDIQDVINYLDLDNLDDINLSLSNSFRDSLQTMVKFNGTDFDELGIMLTIKVDIMNQATNFEIDGTDYLLDICLLVTETFVSLIEVNTDFSDVILKLSEENDRLNVAKADREITTKQIEDISNQIEDLKAIKEHFIADREHAKKDYEDQLEEMKNIYPYITDELRAVFKDKIMLSFKQFEIFFGFLSEVFQRQISLIISTIQHKFIGLKEHSMNQRAMIVSIYQDFCDAKHYNYTTCEDQHFPYMSDDFTTLLDKLIDMQ